MENGINHLDYIIDYKLKDNYKGHIIDTNIKDIIRKANVVVQEYLKLKSISNITVQLNPVKNLANKELSYQILKNVILIKSMRI